MKPPFPEFIPKAEDESTPEDLESIEPPNLFESEASAEPISRLRDVPFRMLVPNLITLGAICSGLTSIRLAFESRFELAILAVLFAAILDGLDGRVARFLKSSSSFGEQLDSLADFVNFGVAPALIMYLWTLKDARSMGWIVALVFVICACLRLARFNVMLDDPNQADWEVDFFTGVPAPAGALLALLPVYLGFLGVESGPFVTWVSALYVLLIAFLLVSNLPTWSGKRSGRQISRRLVLPLMIGSMLAIALLFSYPWSILSALCLIYLLSIPLAFRDWSARSKAAG